MKINSKSLFLILIPLFLFGCSKKDEPLPAQNAVSVEITKKNHTWFYFDSLTFHKVDKPQHAPAQPVKPWTETIRISSANNAAEGND